MKTIPLPSQRANFEELPELRFRRFTTGHLEEWNALKEQVTQKLAEEFAAELHPETVRKSVNEADSLAALTPFPALFLPALAEEKVRAASAWQERQQRLLNGRSLAFAE